MNVSCYSKNAALLSVDQARQQIDQALASVSEMEEIDLAESLGRILAKTIHSPASIPAQAVSAMDGYAFSSKEIQERHAINLQVVGTSWAGNPFEGKLTNNQCVRIFTGAVVPNSADSVVAQENVSQHNFEISLPTDTKPFKNIRAIGSDVRQGEPLIQAPKKLTAVDLGLLASAGVDQVTVKRQLKIGFFSTGDELISLGTALKTGQIYDSNRYMLNGLLVDRNHCVTDLGVLKDHADELENMLTNASKDFDVLISSGGASVGDADFVKQTLAKCGSVNFWKLAIKPGKPLAFGRIGRCWFFGLPGNPVAVMVTFQQFVLPALRKLAGLIPAKPLQILARCETALHKSPGRQEYQRGILKQTASGEFSVKPADGQDSHQLKAASTANCFIVLNDSCAGVCAGEMVVVEPFATDIACH